MRHSPAWFVFLALCAAAAAWAADDASRAPAPRDARRQASPPAVEACTLLSSADLQAVQGEPLREQKPSHQSSGALTISQCFFSLATYSKSVSLAIAGGPPGSAQDYWRRLQSAGAESEPSPHENKKQAEQRAELYRPQPVSGVGERALWLRSRFGGTLYVLQGDAVLIISVGGKETETARIEKSKQLAARALRRLKS
jgi:hypothetical protein